MKERREEEESKGVGEEEIQTTERGNEEKKEIKDHGKGREEKRKMEKRKEREEEGRIEASKSRGTGIIAE